MLKGKFTPKWRFCYLLPSCCSKTKSRNNETQMTFKISSISINQNIIGTWRVSSSDYQYKSLIYCFIVNVVSLFNNNVVLTALCFVIWISPGLSFNLLYLQSTCLVGWTCTCVWGWNECPNTSNTNVKGFGSRKGKKARRGIMIWKWCY